MPLAFAPPVDRFRDLTDVDWATFADGEIPMWNAGAGKFQGAAASGADSRLTGTGSLALGTFAGTLPASGTLALRDVTNSFSAAQTIFVNTGGAALSVGNNSAGIGIGATIEAAGATGLRSLVNTSAATALPAHLLRYAGVGETPPALVLTTLGGGGGSTAGIGVAATWRAMTSTSGFADPQPDQADLTAAWTDATHSSRRGQLAARAWDSTAAREGWRIGSDGGAALIGFLGTAPAARQSGGAATAGGTWTAAEQSMLQKAYDALRTFGLLS